MIYKNCDNLYDTTIIIGISPCNKYFNEDNLINIFNFVKYKFKDIIIYIPTNNSIFNYLSLGYNEHKSYKKVKKNDNNILNKVIKAINNTNLINYKLYLQNDLEEIKEYKEIRLNIFTLYLNDTKFKNLCQSISKSINNNFNEEIAVNYILYELPIYFASSYIFNKEKCTIMYHSFNELWIELLRYSFMEDNNYILEMKF